MKNAPKVGDTLIVQEDYRPTTYDCVITKVGRKLVHVHTGPMWNPMSFRIDPTKGGVDAPSWVVPVTPQGMHSARLVVAQDDELVIAVRSPSPLPRDASCGVTLSTRKP